MSSEHSGRQPDFGLVYDFLNARGVLGCSLLFAGALLAVAGTALALAGVGEPDGKSGRVKESVKIERGAGSQEDPTNDGGEGGFSWWWVAAGGIVLLAAGWAVTFASTGAAGGVAGLTTYDGFIGWGEYALDSPGDGPDSHRSLKPVERRNTSKLRFRGGSTAELFVGIACTLPSQEKQFSVVSFGLRHDGQVVGEMGPKKLDTSTLYLVEDGVLQELEKYMKNAREVFGTLDVIRMALQNVSPSVSLSVQLVLLSPKHNHPMLLFGVLGAAVDHVRAVRDQEAVRQFTSEHGLLDPGTGESLVDYCERHSWKLSVDQLQ